MKLAVPKEIRPGERRAAATPETTARLIKLGFEVLIESGAGAGASFSDEDYQAAGARVVSDTRQLWQEADIVLKVQPPDQHPRLGVHEVDLLREGRTLISFLFPGKNKDLVERLARAQGHRPGDGSGPAHHPRPEGRRALLDGQHRRLPGDHRGGQLLRPLLHRPDDGRRPGPAGQGARHRRGRRRPGRHRRRPGHGRHRARLRHAPLGQGAGQEHGGRVHRARRQGGGRRGRAATPGR